jgi:hypothetical protein
MASQCAGAFGKPRAPGCDNCVSIVGAGIHLFSIVAAMKPPVVELGWRRRSDNDHHINFDAPAILRKWPSLNNQRSADGTGPYLLYDGTLGECLREFMAKPAPTRQLYEIHTSPQPPLIAGVLSGESLAEVARFASFSKNENTLIPPRKLVGLSDAGATGLAHTTNSIQNPPRRN